MGEIDDEQVAQILEMLGGMIEKESDLVEAWRPRFREAVSRGYIEMVQIGRLTDAGYAFLQGRRPLKETEQRDE